MPHQRATPCEADALRPLAQSISHAQIPAALKLLLLALLAALSVATYARHPLRRPQTDWLLSITTDTSEDPDSAWDPHVLRRFRRRRARLGWLMRCDRAEGMSLSGHRAPALRPTQAARAPPAPSSAQNPPESVAKTPRSAAMSHGQSLAPPSRRVESVRSLAHVIARRGIVADPDLGIPAAGHAASNMGGVAPNHLGVVAAHLAGRAAVARGVVVPPLIHPHPHHLGG